MRRLATTGKAAWTLRYWILALIAVVAAGGIFVAVQPDRSDLLPVRLGSQTIRVEVARTPLAQQKGLSGRMTLARDRGMLFVFGRPGKYCFWMKDMKFDLDILWLDDNKRVVFMEGDISPRSYPNSSCPDQLARYVLEVNAGLSERADVKLGDRLIFENPAPWAHHLER